MIFADLGFSRQKIEDSDAIFPLFVCFLPVPPVWRKTGALALRQQVFFTNH